MLLTFGRSAFAMPPISGVVLAAGSASASAAVSGNAKASKNGYGGAVGAAAATASPLRTAYSSGQVATGRALPAAAAKYFANAVAAASTKALPAATARCDFNSGAGLGTAKALPNAVAFRIFKLTVAGGIFAKAVAEGEGQNWVRVVPLTVQARAHVWGTFHPVAYGDALQASGAQAQAVRTRQSASALGAKALVTSSAPKCVASGGGASVAKVIPIAAARHKVGAVGYQDGFGDAVGKAVVAAGAVSTNPVMLIVARAVPQAFAEVAYAVRGDAIAEAITATGESNLLPTIQLGGVIVSSAATGVAMTTCYITSALGQCSVQAHPAAATLRTAAAGGVLLSIAVDAADATVLKLAAGAIELTCTVAGDVLRTAHAGGAGLLAAALADAGVQLNPLGPSTYVIEVELPDNFIEALVPETLVTVDAIDTLVEAA